MAMQHGRGFPAACRRIFNGHVGGFRMAMQHGHGQMQSSNVLVVTKWLNSQRPGLTIRPRSARGPEESIADGPEAWFLAKTCQNGHESDGV